MRFFVGAYTADGDGDATGIGVVHAGEPDGPLAGGQLSMRADAVRTGGSPSWLAWHPTLDVLYAALEHGGVVQAFRRTGPDSFVVLGEPAAVGELACHVAVEPGGRWLVASCWGDGRVVRLPLAPDGRVGTGVVAAAATDPYAALDMNRPSRAHHARFVGTRTVVTTDLGLDQVRAWHPSSDGLREVDRVVLPQGTGPRHTVWHPSGHLYVVTEFSLELFVLAPPSDGNGWRLVAAGPVSPGALPGADAAAEISLSADAEFAYVGLRGTDTIATLRVRGTGATVQPVALVESGVTWPRHHLVARDTLLVAGQRSDEVASLALDLRTGIPGRVRHRVSTPSPSQLLADRPGAAG